VQDIPKYLLLENLSSFSTIKDFPEPLMDHQLKIIFTQLLSAILYIHQRNIAHLDIKPDNVMMRKVTESIFVVKLIDFGISCCNGNTKHRCNKQTMLPPEAKVDGSYFPIQADMYNFG
jgi:serine/threonine protein kinase